MAYADKINQAKRSYPFSKWRKAYGAGLTVYTQENCDKAKKIFDDLIERLIAEGEKTVDDEKIRLFQIAIEATNALNVEVGGGLIETGEREELCELTNVISLAAGLDPNQYGGGEGLASEWREW